MAASRKRETTKKETTEKTTTAKTTTKKGTGTKSKIKLTFTPILGAADQFTALLREKTIKNDYGREIASYTPAIEGLPMKLTVRKGEVIEVTEEQFKALQELGHAETDEEYKEREKFIQNLSAQHPDTLSWEMIVAEGSNFATLRQSQFIIYNDKLVRV